MNLLLLGGSGFIGKSFIKHATGFSIDIISRSGDSSFAENTNIFNYKDYFNKKFLDKYHTIIYLNNPIFPRSPAHTSIEELAYNELVGLNNIASHAHNNKKRFVFLSSGGAVYGIHKGIPLNEDSECKPISHYGKMKLDSETLLLEIFDDKKDNLLILRPSNPYGLLQGNQNNGVIMEFIRSFKYNYEINIFGDGNGKKDYIFIEDLIRTMEILIKKQEFGIFNIGSGLRYSLLEIIEILEARFLKKLTMNFYSKDANDVYEFELDLSKINKYQILSDMKHLKDVMGALIRQC